MLKPGRQVALASFYLAKQLFLSFLKSSKCLDFGFPTLAQQHI